jgi:hypothetical protein
LRKIAGKAWLALSIDWNVHRCPCLTTSAQSLHSLSGKESMGGVAKNLAHRLELSGAVNDEAHLKWAKASNSGDGEATFDLWEASGQRNVSYLHRSHVLKEVRPEGPVPSSLARLLRVPQRSAMYGGVLLKRPYSRVDDSHPPPTFCFMVFDDTSFDDEFRLACKILRAFISNHFHIARFGRGIGRGVLSKSDRSTVKAWTNILFMMEGPDAQWPDPAVN